MGEVNIEALSGVDFTIDKGEFVVVAGASGAGKSTILNILGGMDSPTSGEIIVDNNKISVKFSECRGEIFYEMAKNVVFSSVSVVDKYSKLSTGYVEK